MASAVGFAEVARVSAATGLKIWSCRVPRKVVPRVDESSPFEQTAFTKATQIS